MITVEKTDKYNINPKNIINSAFETSYVKSLDTLPQAPPDKISTVFSSISMILLAALFIMTAYYDAEKNQMIWFTLAAACFGLIAYFVTKFKKAKMLYKNASSKTDIKESKKNAFFALFNYEELPEIVMATDLQRKVSPLLSKQTDVATLTALRSINETLSKKNNPSDTLCKLLNTFGDIFTQPKRRLYMSVDGDMITFYDADFMNPIGQILCTVDNIESFGEFSKYPAKINIQGGGKIKPDSIILELKDEVHNIFMEFKYDEYDFIKKVAGGKKEKK